MSELWTTQTVVPFIGRAATAVTEDDSALIDALLRQLSVFTSANATNQEYYEGTHLAQMIGISTPPAMRTIKVVSGWAGAAVDAIEERLDWYGWDSDGDPYGLKDVFEDNRLAVESSPTHIDALICGVTFVSVGTGGEGEPDVLVTEDPPTTTTGAWDPRRRVLSSALTVVETGDGFGDATVVSLKLPDRTELFERVKGGWVSIERDDHQLGAVPVVQMENRPRGTRRGGRSEITAPMKYLVDAASRTLLGAETNREFYQAPQRAALGADESMFQDENGNIVSPWTSIQGRVWMLPRDEEGNMPSVQQFDPSSPAPFLDLIRGYAQLMAHESALPPSSMGFQTDNPASADAIRASEARLVKRAQRRQALFGTAWYDVARLAVAVRDGVPIPRRLEGVRTAWNDPATPTRAAAADEAQKLIAAGVLPPNSSVTYARLGITPAEQDQLERDHRRASGRAALTVLASRQAAAAAGGVGVPVGV